jgi:hypothetical protein
VGKYSRSSKDGKLFRGVLSTLVYLPISGALVAELQQTVFGVMPFAAPGAFQVAAPGGSLAIVIFGNGKCGPATARDEVHL